MFCIEKGFDSCAYFFWSAEFLVVRFRTPSATASNTHNPSKQIGEHRTNTTLLHIVGFLQPYTDITGPGQPPGSARAMLLLQTDEPEKQRCQLHGTQRSCGDNQNLILPTLNASRGKQGVYNLFPEFHSSINTLEYYSGPVPLAVPVTICLHHKLQEIDSCAKIRDRCLS